MALTALRSYSEHDGALRFVVGLEACVSVRWEEWESALKRSWKAALADEPRLLELFTSAKAKTYREDGDDDPPPSGVWVTGIRTSSGVDTLPHLTAWFGVEAVDFDGDEPRNERGLMVSLDVALEIESKKHLRPAIDRVATALGALRGARSVEYPYQESPEVRVAGHPEAPPPVLVLRDRSSNEYLDRSVWLSFRLEGFSSSDIVSDVARLAANRMVEHLDWIRSTVDEARGAIAVRRAVSPIVVPIDVVTGWAGEVVARARLDGGTLRYGLGWFANFDLRDAGDQRVEVKTTVATAGGVAYWPRSELQLARKLRGNYRLVFVRVDAKVVEELTDALKRTQGAGGGIAEGDVDAFRLAEALRVTGCDLTPPLSAVARAVKKLHRHTGTIVEVRNPIDRFGLDGLHPAVRDLTLDFSTATLAF